MWKSPAEWRIVPLALEAKFENPLPIAAAQRHQQQPILEVEPWLPCIPSLRFDCSCRLFIVSTSNLPSFALSNWRCIRLNSHVRPAQPQYREEEHTSVCSVPARELLEAQHWRSASIQYRSDRPLMPVFEPLLTLLQSLANWRNWRNRS